MYHVSRILSILWFFMNHVVPEHGKMHMMHDTRYMMYMIVIMSNTLPDHVEHVICITITDRRVGARRAPDRVLSRVIVS